MVDRRQIVAQVGAILAYLIDDFLDDDDGDDALWEKITVNVDEYCRMGDPSFQWHFRLRKPVFELLLQEVGNFLVNENRLIRERRPLAHIVLMVLWIMATPDSFRSVALRFGVHKSELHKHYVYIIETWRDMSAELITWPNARERNVMERVCRGISQFPGVVGIMDGSHVSIIAPEEDKAAHRNYHHGYSIKVQAVVDHNYVVRDVYIGEAGSLHDARVFRRSPLFQNMLQRADMFSAGQHIIADSAYMLLNNVLCPFVNNGHLTARQRNFNRRLSMIRARVEHTFAHVDVLWRRMFHLPNTNLEYAVDHIAASIFLHNFKIIRTRELIYGNNDDGDEDDFLNDNDHNNAGGEPEDVDPDDPGYVDPDDPGYEDESDDSDGPDDDGYIPGVNDVLHDPHVPEGNIGPRLVHMQMLGEQKRWDICNRLPL